MWLGKLANEMKDTLTELLVECLNVGKKGSKSGVDPLKYPSQVCIARPLLEKRTLQSSPVLIFLPYFSIFDKIVHFCS